MTCVGVEEPFRAAGRGEDVAVLVVHRKSVAVLQCARALLLQRGLSWHEQRAGVVVVCGRASRARFVSGGQCALRE